MRATNTAHLILVLTISTLIVPPHPVNHLHVLGETLEETLWNIQDAALVLLNVFKGCERVLV